MENHLISPYLSVRKPKINFIMKNAFCVFPAVSGPLNAEVILIWSWLVGLILKEDLRQSSGISTDVFPSECVLFSAQRGS